MNSTVRAALALVVVEVACMTVGLSLPLVKSALAAGWSWWATALLVPMSVIASIAYLFGIPYAVLGLAKVAGRPAGTGVLGVLANVVPTITLLSGLPLFFVLGNACAHWLNR